MNCSDVPPTEAQKYSSTIKSLRSTIVQYEIEIDSLKSLNTALKSRLAKLQADTSDDYEVELLRGELSKLNLQVSKSLREKEEQVDKNEILQEEVSRLKNENKNLKNENYSLQDENSNMKTENSNLNLKLSKQRSTSQSDDLELKRELTGMMNENSRVANKNYALQEEVERLKEECKEIREERDQLWKLNKLRELTEQLERIGMDDDGEVTHRATCDWCKHTITGNRYKCGNCADYDLCSSCLGTPHDSTHIFLKIRRPLSTNPTTTPLLPRFMSLPIRTHVGICCDECQQMPIQGIRFKCIQCPDFDVCGHCESKNRHDPSHVFIRFTRPIQVPPLFIFNLI